MKSSASRWIALVTLNITTLCMLGFYGSTGAAPKTAAPPFGNSVEQRQQMIRELQEIKALLKEQNGLLKTANAKSPHDPASQR